MSVVTYEIGCNYRHPKLKNKVYFLSKSFFNPSTNEVTVHIDNGGASVSIVTHVPHPTPPNVIEGFGIKFTETESLDERYKFTKQLNISINGHLTDTTWLLENDYYIMVETIEGTFYLINVDFPSEMSFTYNLSNSQDQTDFVFTSNSNFPTLKVNSVPWESFNTCKAYHVPGVDYLKLLEKDYTTIDKENGVVNLFNSQTFKNIDYLKSTISLQETYDGDIATTTISFEIPFDDYKTSWQYNLLEFKQNLYVAEVGNVSGNAIFAGFEHGLEPSYEINGSTSESESTSIKITLTETSNWGIFEYDSWSFNNISEKKWVGVDSEVKCIGLGYGINTLMMEVDENGTPTGRYKCLEGYESEYTDYNIITSYTESDVESFRTSVCTRFRTRSGAQTDMYTCIDGDKYAYIITQISYDGGKNWIDDYETQLGPMVESASSWCELPTDTKWVLTDEWGCRRENGGGGFNGKVKLTLKDSSEIVISCDMSSAITANDTSSYKKNIVSVEIGNCVTTIGEEAFSDCSGLTSVTMADSVINITSSAFYNCTGLTSVGPVGSGASVEIPNSVKSIDSSAFQICRNITSVRIPNGVTSIGESSFMGCNRLTSITIPNSVTIIGENAFSSCSGLTSVTIPSSVETIGNLAFSNCYSITSVNIQNGVTNIGDAAFLNCTGLTSIIIPDSVTNIGLSSFAWCSGITSCTIGSGVINIGKHAFGRCYGLTSLTIPDSVTTIGASGLTYCLNLKNLNIGSGVTSIGDYGLYRCSSLTNLTIKATTPPTIGGYTLDWTNNCPIYVPPGSMAEYQCVDRWSNYASRIQPIPA